jgi:hypothetical protein
MDTYRVVVTREGDGWLADATELAGCRTWATGARDLDRHIREAIAVVLDLPEGVSRTLWRWGGSKPTKTTGPRRRPASPDCARVRGDPRVVFAYAGALDFAGDEWRAEEAYAQSPWPELDAPSPTRGGFNI